MRTIISFDAILINIKKGHKMKVKILTITFLLSSISYGAVWKTTASWNQQYKSDFKDWMKNKVTTDFFSNPTKKYYGVKVDCADVTYALRAVFAYENGLPFKVRNPVYRRGHRYKHWTNEIPKFDKRGSSKQRFIAFVNFLGNSLGTETLNAYDSYPLKISKVDSADIYSYKKRTSSGYTRHTYNIVDVTETGNFQLIWSNQQRKKEGKPMKYAEWSKLSKRPYKYKWGFRRLNYPGDYSTKQSQREDYSFEQFELAKKLDEKQFFLKVKNSLKTRDEDPNKNLKRQLDNLCSQAKERIDIVKSGDDYRRSINGRCMNYTEYDDYSTPGRDGRFLDLFKRLSETVASYKEEGLYGRVEYALSQDIEGILESQSRDTNVCLIKYKPSATPISLKNIYNGLKTKRFSSHPNDNIDRRWGKSVKSKTSCKTWY